MRFLIVASALLLASPAKAHEEPDAPAAIADIIVAALAPASDGEWAYDWGALSARISSRMHWHLFEPDPRDRPETYVARRSGWIDAAGASIGVSAYGDDADVRELNFEVHDYEIDVIRALRVAGATVETLRESEELSRYRVLVPERRPGWLSRSHHCTNPRARVARRCWDIYDLRFTEPG